MSWVAPTVRTTGDLITAGIWNGDVVGNLSLLKTSIADDGRISGEIKNFWMETLALSISSLAIAFDLSVANVFSFTMNQSIVTTSVFSSIPSSGKYAEFEVAVTANGTAYTWAWFASTVVWANGVAPTRTVTNGKVDRFVFTTTNGGIPWIGAMRGQAFSA